MDKYDIILCIIVAVCLSLVVGMFLGHYSTLHDLKSVDFKNYSLRVAVCGNHTYIDLDRHVEYVRWALLQNYSFNNDTEKYYFHDPLSCTKSICVNGFYYDDVIGYNYPGDVVLTPIVCSVYRYDLMQNSSVLTNVTFGSDVVLIPGGG